MDTLLEESERKRKTRTEDITTHRIQNRVSEKERKPESKKR